MLLLKYDGYILFLQLTHIFQTVNCISGKSADWFCDYHINFPGHAIVDHLIEAFAFLGVGSRNTVVCVNACKLSFLISSNIFCVMVHLCFIAACLLIADSTNSAVRCDSELRFIFFYDFVTCASSGRYQCDILIHAYPPRSCCRHILLAYKNRCTFLLPYPALVLELQFRRCLKFSYTILASGVAPPKLLYLFKYLFIHNLRIIIGSQVDLVSQ